jgi:hypothetical protein
VGFKPHATQILDADTPMTPTLEMKLENPARFLKTPWTRLQILDRSLKMQVGNPGFADHISSPNDPQPMKLFTPTLVVCLLVGTQIIPIYIGRVWLNRALLTVGGTSRMTQMRPNLDGICKSKLDSLEISGLAGNIWTRWKYLDSLEISGSQLFQWFAVGFKSPMLDSRLK